MQNRVFSSVADAGVTKRIAFIEGELALALTGQEDGCRGILVCMEAHDVSDVEDHAGTARPRTAALQLVGEHASYASALVDVALIDGLMHTLRTGFRIPDVLAFRERATDDVLIICGPHQQLGCLAEKPFHADKRVLIASGRHARTIVARLAERGAYVRTGTTVKRYYDRCIAEILAMLPQEAPLPLAAE